MLGIMTIIVIIYYISFHDMMTIIDKCKLVTICLCERAFSKMTIIRTKLRGTMTPERETRRSNVHMITNINYVIMMK